jgi:hypothetical protein
MRQVHGCDFGRIRLKSSLPCLHRYRRNFAEPSGKRVPNGVSTANQLVWRIRGRCDLGSQCFKGCFYR